MNRQLVVTGMHRSGTSLLANAAERAGVVMGSRLMAASKGNRHGHFEDLDFVHFHERLLESRGWSALRPPDEPLAVSADEEAEARALAAARSELPLWGFKDPRTTLVLDLWDRVLPAPAFFLVYRHPVEVAMSLLRRGLDVEVQLDPGVAVRAWTIYNTRLLEFFLARRDRCLLAHVRGAADALPDAFGRLGRMLGTAFPSPDVAAAFASEDLRTGLWARGIDWPAVLPEAMDLYARLEEEADLPGGPEPDPGERPSQPSQASQASRPSPSERDLGEAAEHLLARALAAPRAEAPVPAQLRVDYSELRLFAARQEERIAQLAGQIEAGEEERRALARAHAEALGQREAEARRLAGELARRDAEIDRLTGELHERDARWLRLEATRGFRLLNSFWNAVARARSTRGEDEVVIAGCVTENTPAMLGETLRLVQSTRWFGGDLARARFLVCAVETIDPEARRALEGYGAEIRVVQRFDPRNPTANKLRFLEEATRTAGDNDLILLLDCDMVVARDPLPFFERGALAAKIADVPSVTHEAFERLFEHFGLPLLPRSYVTTLLDEPTMAYFNTAVTALPGFLAREIVPVWVDFNRRIVDVRDQLMGSCAHHSHQASLTLALAAHPVPVAAAPVEINYPLHLTHIDPPPRRMLEADPAILHYHKLVDAEGFLLPSPYPLAQARIEAFNRRLREERSAAADTAAAAIGQ